MEGRASLPPTKPTAQPHFLLPSRAGEEKRRYTDQFS
jgi:hypothetical protein